jgi:valyl-tRNA synthetase
VADNASLEAIVARIDPARLDRYDQWILSRLLETTALNERIYENYELHQVTQSLYAFFWGVFCDWFVEASKAKLQDPQAAATTLAIQDLVIRQTLLLLHPITPHITEELWRRWVTLRRASASCKTR